MLLDPARALPTCASAFWLFTSSGNPLGQPNQTPNSQTSTWLHHRARTLLTYAIRCYSLPSTSSYSQRMQFYLQKVFVDEYSGKSGIDYFEALDTEFEESKKTSDKFPDALKPKVLRACQFRECPATSIYRKIVCSLCSPCSQSWKDARTSWAKQHTNASITVTFSARRSSCITLSGLMD